MQAERKIGTCEMCGGHRRMVWSCVGQVDGQIWAGWICQECLRALNSWMYDARKAEAALRMPAGKTDDNLENGPGVK